MAPSKLAHPSRTPWHFDKMSKVSSSSPSSGQWPALCASGAGSSMATQPFRFFDLYPELRRCVYEFMAPDYSVINDTIGKEVSRAQQSPLWDNEANTKHFSPPFVKMTTPPVLLVCRQMYSEIQPYMKRKTLYLNHGLFNFKLHKLISNTSLRNISSIVLSHHGHNILSNRLRMSFVGHQNLVKALVDQFKLSGHQLKYLELRFDSPQLEYHAKHCLGQRQPTDPTCDMQYWLEKIVNKWCLVRGIKKVKITGWLPEAMKERMLSAMQAQPSPLLRLPENVLQRIASYGQTLDSVNRAINRLNVPYGSVDENGDFQMTDDSHIAEINAQYEALLECPNLLLVDSVHSNIFHSIIVGHTLKLDLKNPPANDDVLSIENYIGHDSLIAVKGLHITIRHRAWLALVANLARCGFDNENLQHVHLHLEDSKRVAGASYPDEQLELMLDHLRYISKVSGSVTFGGDLARPFGKGKKFLRQLAADMKQRDNDVFMLEQKLFRTEERKCPFRGKHALGDWRGARELVQMSIYD